ncbi:hypothetical protein D3C73_1024800 [compost metagenome]
MSRHLGNKVIIPARIIPQIDDYSLYLFLLKLFYYIFQRFHGIGLLGTRKVISDFYVAVFLLKNLAFNRRIFFLQLDLRFLQGFVLVVIGCKRRSYDRRIVLIPEFNLDVLADRGSC